MARKTEPATGEPQGDMFGFRAGIQAIALNSPTIGKGGILTAELTAVTEATGTEFLTPGEWFKAVVRWAMRLCGGSISQFQAEMNAAWLEYWDQAAETKARQLDEEIGFARVKDDDENRRRSENLAERLFDILGIDVFPGEIDGWSDGQRAEVRSFLVRVLQSREGGPWVDMAKAPECLRDALAREGESASASQQDAAEIGEAAAVAAEGEDDAGGNVVALRT